MKIEAADQAWPTIDATRKIVRQVSQLWIAHSPSRESRRIGACRCRKSGAMRGRRGHLERFDAVRHYRPGATVIGAAAEIARTLW
ncbi:hypothetical protein ABTM00_19945, partial [Acinetobacter baumannii]